MSIANLLIPNEFNLFTNVIGGNSTLNVGNGAGFTTNSSIFGVAKTVNVLTVTGSLTTLQLLNSIQTFAGATAIVISLPTAAAVVAAIGASLCPVGTTYTLNVVNSSGTGTITFTPSASFAIPFGGVIATSSNARFIIYIDNNTLGSEHITMYQG